MQYFRPYSVSPKDGVVAAWDSQLASAADIPNLRRLIAERGAEIFPEFARRYAEIRALPRSARRALHRRLAASRELAGIPGEWRRKLAYTVAGAALLLALENAPAQSGTINVGPTCTLVDAITSANNGSNSGGCTGATGGPNTIVLPKGTQTLTNTYNGQAGYDGLPNIKSDITIQGNGARIVRSASAPHFRLVAIDPNGILRLKNTTLSGGNTLSSGGAISVDYGSLYLENCTLSGNTVGSKGGAIFNFHGYVSIAGGTISRNTAGDSGGGLSTHYGLTKIQDSIITGNHADGPGGGIYGVGNSDVISLKRTTVSRNTAGARGGGIRQSGGYTYIEDHTIITGNIGSGGGGGVAHIGGYLGVSGSSTISKNTAITYGGIFTEGDRTYISNSTITGNKTAPGGSGGGVGSFASALHIYSSTISKNLAGTGGGIYSQLGRAEVYNSIITGNKAGKNGGGVYSGGLNPGSIYIYHSTITKNSAGMNGGGVENFKGTLGIYNSTIITGNKAGVRGGGVDNTAPYAYSESASTISGNSAPTGPNHYP